MDIPVKIDPIQVIPDLKTLTGPVTEGLRTDVAVLAAVGEMAAQLGRKLPSGITLRRAD